MFGMFNTVNFPGLGIYLEINPVAFKVFGLEIRWYAIIIAFGLTVAMFYGLRQSDKYNLSKDNVLDVVIYGGITAIVCARLYFVISEWDYYSDNLLEIFNTRGGGMAIYGAIIGAVIATFVYCRVKKVNIGSMFDVGALGLLIGQCIGRWANFINAEAYGGPTNLPWRMEVFDLATLEMTAVHPTFLYESLWNLGAFVLLHFYNKRKKFDGEIFWMYIAVYGVGRAWIEQLRTDSLPYGANFKISQIVAIVSCIAAVVAIIINRRKIKVTDGDIGEQDGVDV